MMLAEDRVYTRATLAAAIVERFGAETRFHTCSANNMTAEALVTFLANRGKFVEAEEGFKTAPERICAH